MKTILSKLLSLLTRLTGQLSVSCDCDLPNLPSARRGKVPSCTFDCHAAIDMFRQFACHKAFEDLSQHDGGAKLRFAGASVGRNAKRKAQPHSPSSTRILAELLDGEQLDRKSALTRSTTAGPSFDSRLFQLAGAPKQRQRKPPPHIPSSVSRQCVM